MPRRRPPDHRQREHERRAAGGTCGRRRTASGPTRPGPGGQLGDRLVGRGGFERAGAAAVDELQRGQRADPADRLGAPLAQFRRRAGLHRPDERGAHRVPGRRVAEARDLALVAEHADERETRPRAGSSRRTAPPPPGSRSGDRQVPTCTTGPSASGRQDMSRSRQTRIAGWPAPSVASMKSRWPAESTVTVMCCRAAARRPPAPAARRGPRSGRRPAGRRRAAGVQPERLGQRVGHDAPVSWPGQDALDQVPAAQRLAHHPDGHAAGPPDQVARVGVERGRGRRRRTAGPGGRSPARTGPGH